MNIEKLEKDLRKLTKNINQSSFIYDLLKAYELPSASISRLKSGDYNLAKMQDEILWKNRLFFKADTLVDLHVLIDTVKKESAITKQKPRFLIVTDWDDLLAVDTKTEDTLDIKLKELAKHFDFFLPWAGMEKSQVQSESLADIRAAERMGKLYDQIRLDNPLEEGDNSNRHALNVFLARLLFCFFAEDTGIFADGQFTNAIASHTADDGHDLQSYLQKLFKVLNSETRSEFPQFLQDFPYVNGGLFRDDLPVPKFTRRSRNLIIESGSLNWKQINPDIFGSMIQAVVHDDQRSSLGMHYTSVTNIMKVIQPLFLDELYEELDAAGDNRKKLEALLDRLHKIRIFDPACGSGNFLIIAYKELCKLEIEILKRMQGTQMAFATFTSKIKLNQFYGIELDDFAHETAKLSLWLAEHQMNLAFKDVFGTAKPTLPLQEGGNIVCGNATRLEWEKVCPKSENHKVFILGNPPYAGQRNHTDSQKRDMEFVFAGEEYYKKLDYIACWFFKGAKYLDSNSTLSFVTTNSICQGLQVSLLWPRIFQFAVEIFFAYEAFKWSNHAKNNAGVTCTIIGIRRKSAKNKFLFQGNVKSFANNINAYLIQGSNIIVSKRLKPISDLPKMQGGNQPREGGYLMLTDSVKNELVMQAPEVQKYIRPLMGSDEFIKGKKRWCIWIEEDQVSEARLIPELNDRIEKVQHHRENGNSVEKSFSHVPYRFVTIKSAKYSQILIPIVSSENRKYIPIGLLDRQVAVTSKAFVIFDSEPFIFGVLTSLMHMIWVKTVSGTRGTSISYSSQICYNTFPFPKIKTHQKDELEELVFNILDVREQYSEKTMAQLYDPEKMPSELILAHNKLDTAIEKCYRPEPFSDNLERLQFLFQLYEQMIIEETNEGDQLSLI